MFKRENQKINKKYNQISIIIKYRLFSDSSSASFGASTDDVKIKLTA